MDLKNSLILVMHKNFKRKKKSNCHFHQNLMIFSTTSYFVGIQKYYIYIYTHT